MTTMLKALQLLVLSTLLELTTAIPKDTPENTTTPIPQAKLIHQYTPPTWVENLAVRPNGLILPITTTSSILNQLDPSTGSLTLIHDFSSSGNAIQGITEIHPDLFVLNVLTCNITGNLLCTPGSLSTWTVDFTSRKHDDDDCEGEDSQLHRPESSPKPIISKITTFPTAGFLNGIATLSPPNNNIILMADSYKGGIWSLNLQDPNKTSFLFSDLSMNGTAAVANGINGLRVRGSSLYFTNSALGTFNVIPIDPATAMKAGEARVIASGLAAPDDFEVDEGRGVAYVCNGFVDQVVRIGLESGEMEVVGEVPGPTSVRYGPGVGEKDRKVYVSTIGGLMQYVEHNITVGGAVYEIEV